ncbi:hypothetical protein E2C01_013449 [Portunus trituberculatus]|uniref:Uncharacterized protein n=1 Tax=Portunus trituberculatus TaxID=210409 RepID=A0A5B7DH61_PORTR|nr:hypothetical protein [Portunus trituberculatus]
MEAQHLHMATPLLSGSGGGHAERLVRIGVLDRTSTWSPWLLSLTVPLPVGGLFFAATDPSPHQTNWGRLAAHGASGRDLGRAGPLHARPQGRHHYAVTSSKLQRSDLIRMDRLFAFTQSAASMTTLLDRQTASLNKSQRGCTSHSKAQCGLPLTGTRRT